MKVSGQKTISARILGVGKNKVWFDKNKLSEIKEAITKADLRSLIGQRIIQKKPDQGTSRVRARKRIIQRRKGRQTGQGSRKGKRTARLGRKETWMIQVRSQRMFIKELKAKSIIEIRTYRNLYSKVKGGYFRNKRHIKLYLNENKLFLEKKK
jgi:large subunit ribosomal protein L19e